MLAVPRRTRTYPPRAARQAGTTSERGPDVPITGSLAPGRGGRAPGGAPAAWRAKEVGDLPRLLNHAPEGRIRARRIDARQASARTRPKYTARRSHRSDVAG